MNDYPTKIYKSVYEYCKKFNIKKIQESMIEWIPYSQITNMKEIAKGGFGIIYQATWLDGHDKIVAIKQFENSQDISKYFLNEVCIFNIYFLNLIIKII